MSSTLLTLMIAENFSIARLVSQLDTKRSSAEKARNVASSPLIRRPAKSFSMGYNCTKSTGTADLSCGIHHEVLKDQAIPYVVFQDPHNLVRYPRPVDRCLPQISANRQPDGFYRILIQWHGAS